MNVPECERTLCENVAMPNINDVAKAWQLALAERVGKAVQQRRKSVGLTAQALSARTVDLGYPLTRVAISKIESNQRSGKLDVSELLVLAAALDIPPALLLFPDYPVDTVELLPDDREAGSESAVEWLSGERTLPARRADLADGIYRAPPNAGTQLVAAIRKRNMMTHMLFEAETRGDDRYREVMQELRSDLVANELEVLDLRKQLGIAAVLEKGNE